MSRQKRPITQLWDFSRTVAGHSPQQNSAAASNIQALKKHVLITQSRLSPSDPSFPQKDGASPSTFKSTITEQSTGITLQGHYDEFMTLDQAGHAIIGSDNNKESSLVAIKRIAKVDKSPMNPIAPFTSDHLVQIKNIYEDGDDIVIIYETMDVTLRQIIGILQGPLKAFQIAAICKEVSQSHIF